RIFENPTLVGHVPDVPVTGIDLLARCGDWNVVLRGVGNRVLAASNLPFAPGSDDRQVGCKGSIRKLEPDLIVAFSGAAVGKRIGSDAPGDFDLTAGEERPAHGSAKQIFP